MAHRSDSLFDSAATGRRGEDIAAGYLAGCGFEILERGWRSGRLEIDIIAFKDGIVHIVEVKCRRNRSSGIDEFAPEFAMTIEKQGRLLAAADDYLLEKNCRYELSLDLIAVNINPEGESLRFYEGLQW